MKRPEIIKFFPLDKKKADTTFDNEKGMWFYMPEWICRAYKLNKMVSNMGRVTFIIRDKNRAYNVYKKEQNIASKYFQTNWQKKIDKERIKERRVVKGADFE